MKAGPGPASREEAISAFSGKDNGSRFECLLGCGEGFYGVRRRDTYLYGKSVFPTVYMPEGSVQWTIPAGTYLKAEFSEKETRDLTIEGAWKFLKDIYIPSCRYACDGSNPFEIEYYSYRNSGHIQLWVPVI